MEETKKISRSAYYYLPRKKQKSNVCVYQQLDENDVVFYVGAGPLADALSPMFKGKQWIKKAKQGYYTKIIQRGLSLKDAMDLRDKFISEIGLLENGGTLINKIKVNEPRRSNSTFTLDPTIIQSIQKKLKNTEYLYYKSTRKIFYEHFLLYDCNNGFHVRTFSEACGISIPSTVKYLDEVFGLCGLERN